MSLHGYEDLRLIQLYIYYLKYVLQNSTNAPLYVLLVVFNILSVLLFCGSFNNDRVLLEKMKWILKNILVISLLYDQNNKQKISPA